MPSKPGVFTKFASKASGAEVEMTPLTAVDPDEENKWRHRFNKQMNRHMAEFTQQGVTQEYYNSSSDLPPHSTVELPRKVRVTQKKRLSKWRLIFMIVFIISVLLNVASITLLVYWYVKFKEIRTIWNQTFAAPTPSPSSSS